jgi:hypothetical protein
MNDLQFRTFPPQVKMIIPLFQLMSAFFLIQSKPIENPVIFLPLLTDLNT